MVGAYAQVSGRGQAVLVHVDAGTANAAMGMHNLYRSRMPVLLMAGRSPHTLHGELPGSRDNYVYFVQDPFDIGSLVRPYVKWEYTLPSGVVALLDALAHACSMAVFEASPTSLCMPRSSPCFGGFDPGAAMADADFGLLIDVDVPWLPKYTQPNPATHWTLRDPDVRSRLAAMAVTTDSGDSASFAKTIATELELWATVAKAANIKAAQ